MALIGTSIVAAKFRESDGSDFFASNPASGERLQPAFQEAGSALVERAVNAAERDFNSFRGLPHSRRAEFLQAIAEQLRNSEGELIERAIAETGLPLARLQGELTRTVNQLVMFADFIRAGNFLQTQVTPAQPERQPLPCPDLRRSEVPLGPVAVFGASNFPLAFSVAGGDTAAAFAAGCPVIVKGHPAHPGTCELAGRAIVAALEQCRLPGGIFSLLQGGSHQLGAALVSHPLLRAVAFTGSYNGGKALFDLAAQRPLPIPVYAEMGSINPIFVLPQALAAGGEELATAYAESISFGVGQFCTNPGALFALQGAELNQFATAVAVKLADLGAGVMLHAGIKQNYLTALDTLSGQPGVERHPALVESVAADGCLAAPALLRTTAETFLANPALAEEVFGPAAVIIACASEQQLSQCAAQLTGQLTATVHAASTEAELCKELFSILERKAGRLIYNGFPTGVEVCPAMIHGGPFPATTDSRSTSVGTEAIRRFLRPVCWQNVPAEILPPELRHY